MAIQSAQRDVFSVMSSRHGGLAVDDVFSEKDSFRLEDGTKLFFWGFRDDLPLGSVSRVLVFGLHPGEQRPAFPKTGKSVLLALVPEEGQVKALSPRESKADEHVVVVIPMGEPLTF